MKVEEDVTGLIIFSCLLVGFLFTFYSMYKRLDHAADPTRRMMAYDMVSSLANPAWLPPGNLIVMILPSLLATHYLPMFSHMSLVYAVASSRKQLACLRSSGSSRPHTCTASSNSFIFARWTTRNPDGRSAMHWGFRTHGTATSGW